MDHHYRVLIVQLVNTAQFQMDPQYVQRAQLALTLIEQVVHFVGCAILVHTLVLMDHHRLVYHVLWENMDPMLVGGLYVSCVKEDITSILLELPFVLVVTLEHIAQTQVLIYLQPVSPVPRVHMLECKDLVHAFRV